MPLRTKAQHIRQDIIRILAKKGGHTASNLSAADIFTTLYFTTLKYHPQQTPKNKIVVAKQLEPAWHTAMAHSGYFSKKELLHPGKELPSGAPEGHGLGIAIGRATASQQNTYCVISDAELQDGRLWEAAALAGTRKINNLTLIIDRNNLHADGFMNIEPVRAKFEAFNWNVIEVDGHNIEHINEALQEKNEIKPTVILAHTIPGKGVGFIENNPEWHEKTPTKEEEQKAITELR